VVLDDFGLEYAVSSHVDLVRRQHGIPIDVHTSGDLSSLEPEVATHLYRIVQEALTNVVRHAGASQARVSITRDGAGTAMAVEDDGRGLPAGDGRDASGARVGLGLTSMRERAALMGGTLSLGNGELGGLRVSVRVPSSP
jgi:signal transduction histidine kinase